MAAVRRNLVTGASGFLGSHLVEGLLAKGEHVVAMVRKSSDRSHLDRLGVEVVECALDDAALLVECFPQVDRVFNCAAMVSDWGSWEDFRLANVVSVQNLIAASCKTGVQLFMHVSSTDVYGHPDVPVDETAPLRRRGFPYGDTKIEAEEVLWKSVEEYGLPIVVVRPASIYGPRSKTFGDFAAEMIRDRTPLVPVRRSAGLIEVTNAVHAMLLLADSPQSVGRAYNLTDGGSTSFRDYFDRLAQELRLPPPLWLPVPRRFVYAVAAMLEFIYRSFGVRTAPPLTRSAVDMLTTEQGFSNERLRTDVNFEPLVDFDEGMRRLAEDLLVRQANVEFKPLGRHR